MEPSKEAIAVRITRLNRQILGKVGNASSKINKKTIDREALLDALTVLYDECNEDPVKKCDELVRAFVDKYRSTLAELRRTRVCISDFEVVQTIGRGHFGEVHMVREKQTGDVYALKSIRKEQARQRVTSAEDERDILSSAHTQWIPRLQYAFQDSSTLYLVMELCNGGDLAGLLARRNHPLSERDSAFYIAEVAHALKALHAMGYVHRDVKPHNILLDRCGHVKLGDFGSCARLSEGGWAAGGTADYVAPELLAAADCAATHTVCLDYCRGIHNTAISACDYWSLGVVAFELVTLKRPFSTSDEDSIAQVLSNIQKYERDPESGPPFEAACEGALPSDEWRALVAGLLRVSPARRYNYLDTLRHPALAHLALHAIRHQVPPWVPVTRGPEDASHFSPAPRPPPTPSAAPFRTRPPFAGQLPFVGYSYVAPEENEDSSGGFNASHDCTAIDLATFKSAEKLAAMRAREIASLQQKLASAEADAAVAADRVRRDADVEAERQRSRLQADITALTLQNKRLERQVEVEKEERMALQRTNQELSTSISDRTNSEIRSARAQVNELQLERDSLREQLTRVEGRVAELQAECASAQAAADNAKSQQQHYKDTIAKERALRRQTISGSSEADAARLAAAEASAAREAQARQHAEDRLNTAHTASDALHSQLDQLKIQLAAVEDELEEKRRLANTCSQQLHETQLLLTQERTRASGFLAQVQELERCVESAAGREAALEEQCARTEARLAQRLQEAEERAAAALHSDARYRDKVNTLEQLVRQLEREVSALEKRSCTGCLARETESATQTPRESDRDGECGRREGEDTARDARSDTESVSDAAQGQLALLKEQLERAEVQLQARAEEMATLRQEARASNLARWKKEKECNDLSLDAKITARDLKRAEERIASILEAKKTADQKASTLQSEIATLKPLYEQVKREAEQWKEQLQKMQKTNEVLQIEVDRSRNDIRKLRSELQYSERRRLHAEEQEELSARERAQLRDELAPLRGQHDQLSQNNKALQEACTLLEEQLTDLEKLADLHELKNKDLENEVQRLRSELDSGRTRAAAAERAAAERAAAAAALTQRADDAEEQLRLARSQLNIMRERLDNRESLIVELEERIASLESEGCTRSAALENAARRLRDLHEECAALRTTAHHHHTTALQLQASLADAQEEAMACREAGEAAAAWWRTRETKADATLRQQAKLIDFLQAKVEEAGRKKCSLSNKLFGRSGRRGAASPPLLRVNRELREEVERLRAKLSASNAANEANYPPSTPRRDKKSERPIKVANGIQSLMDTPELEDDSSLLIVWSDGLREKMQARESDGCLSLAAGPRTARARLARHDLPPLPHNEANRAFPIKVEDTPRGSTEAAAVCATIEARNSWVARLRVPGEAPPAGYRPPPLAHTPHAPHAALYLGQDTLAIGGPNGLRSLRGVIQLEWEDASVSSDAVSGLAACGGRGLLLSGGTLGHASLLPLTSTSRRSAALKPILAVKAVALPDTTAPHLVKAISSEDTEGICAVVACGRRVFVLRFDASRTEFKVARSLTVDRPPDSLLLTTKALYIAGEKPLKINLPLGALESFAMDEPTVAAASKKRSSPKAIVLVRHKPVEILLCYAECGVFVDESGRRTRSEDPKWSTAVHSWEFVSPFLYAVGEDRVTIIYIHEDAYKAPPCTCDTTSLGSATSECCMPEIYNHKTQEPRLLGVTTAGVIICSKAEDGYQISIIEGMAAFRSIGASLESLNTISDYKGSSTDLVQSMPDLPQDVSNESVEITSGFLADIRKKAQEIRSRKRHENGTSSDDIIKKILTTEVGLKRTSNGRKSPAVISEFDSETETESEEGTGSTKCTADVCAEMFARQVRFQ